MDLNWTAFLISAVLFLLTTPLFYLLFEAYRDEKKYNNNAWVILLFAFIVMILVMVACVSVYNIEAAHFPI